MVSEKERRGRRLQLLPVDGSTGLLQNLVALTDQASKQQAVQMAVLVGGT